MGWMQKLCEAYDVGIVSDQSGENIPLVPVGFTHKKVKYHVVLTMDGQFVSANELSVKKDEKDRKGQPQTLEIPSTPQAESRTGSNGAPYSLTEGLNYLAYEDEGNRGRFESYMKQLKAWCDQPDVPACLRAVYTYLDRHTLLSDLNAQPNLKVNYYKDPELRQGEGADRKAMVCFSVQTQDTSTDDLWLRDDVKESWSRYYMQHLPGEKKLCYVEGKLRPATTNYPKVQGNAKLLSAKDALYPFQYKGRFTEDHSAACVSTSVVIRAHNALAWLVERQGIRNKYGMTWVVWNTNGSVMRPATEGSALPVGEEEEEEEYEDGAGKPAIDTLDGYAWAVSRAALGYKSDLASFNTERVNCVEILGMEAATDGRMSITYYQECLGNDYVERLADWYCNCCWWGYNRKKKVTEITTPNTDEIAAAIMGADAVNLARQDLKCEKSQTKLMRQLLSQLMTCIVDRQPLPLSMVNSAFHRCCNPLSFTSGKEKGWDRYGWNRIVNTACAMISCFQKRRNVPDAEVFPPELQTASRNRDYLYGRLLAVADRMEEEVLELKPSLPTNAIRLTQRFAQRPFDTWQMIHEKLIPVFQGAGENAGRYQIAFEEIEGLFLEGDRMSQKPLRMEFLQGYSSQRQAWFTKRDKDRTAPEDAKEPTLYKAPTARSRLYGCLLAIADKVELEANNGERLGRTNAIQMMPMFAARPCESWGRLHDKLIPYLEKLGDKAGYYQTLIGRTETQFSQADREAGKPLDSSYLHGYYGMLRTFYRKTQYCWTPQTWQEGAGDLRSLWYGQMLGAAERLERRMLFLRSGGAPEDEAPHATNALRYMTNFAQKPASTWAYLKVKLQPYLRYGAEHTAASALLEQLEMQLEQQGWDTDTPLRSSYLHGYYAERNRKGE